MKFQRWLFAAAGAYGVATLLPLYWLEDAIGAAAPPAITHVEYFYGFVGVALAWQLVMFVIAADPQRGRPFMPCAVAEKLGFGLAAVVLYAQHRIPAGTLAFGCVDLAFAVAFAAAYLRTSAGAQPTHSRVVPLVGDTSR